MKAKEAKARIKINNLLQEAGWQFFDNENGPAKIHLEPKVEIDKKGTVLFFTKKLLRSVPFFSFRSNIITF